jgi:hypothetical protein
LLADDAGVKTVDCCPENFREMESLPGSAVIDLETLNSALVAVNALFVTKNDDECFKGKDRFTIAAVIFLALHKETL